MTDPEAVAPSCEDLLDEVGVKSVLREADTSWRHGAYITEVFARESDGTFWEAFYRESGDGETNELRDGLATIRRVYPHPVTVIRYSSDRAGESV